MIMVKISVIRNGTKHAAGKSENLPLIFVDKNNHTGENKNRHVTRLTHNSLQFTLEQGERHHKAR